VWWVHTTERAAIASCAMGQMIEFPSNGSTGQGYLAVPTSGSGPGVVVIQEWWGLVPHIKDVCDRFAGEGFVALAPDLYRGTQVTEPDEAGKEMMAMALDRAGQDMSGAVDELRRRSSGAGVGVVGFCMGGGLALVLACQRPDAVTACVPFYGIIPWPEAQPDYSKMRAAVLGHIAEKDRYFSPEAAAALESQLQSLGKDVEFHVYPGADHAFFNDARPEVHDEAASALAWQRTIEFLRERLG
jgi:carboxymethylenebutenolidase